MTTAETGKRQPSPADDQCPGCIERDLEIARLIALVQNRRSRTRKWVLALIGWLVLVSLPTFLLYFSMVLIIRYSISPNYLVTAMPSLTILTFAFSPVVMLIHWRSRVQRVLASFAMTIGVIGVWYFASVYLGFNELTDNILAFFPLISFGMIAAAIPMMVMKIGCRWKLVSRDVGKLGSDPSISTILIFTTACAASFASFQFVEPATWGAANDSVLNQYLGLAISLGCPSLIAGVCLVGSFYFVLVKTRRSKTTVLLITCLLAVTALPSLVVAFQVAFAEVVVQPKDGFWWSSRFATSLVASLLTALIGLLFGLLLACYLRFLGYRIVTSTDQPGRSVGQVA